MSHKVNPSNEEIAEVLDQVAELLDAQNANPFRVMAYRRGAETLRHLNGKVLDILEVEGVDSLTKLPGIGESLAHTIVEIVETGSSSLLERICGQAPPVDLFATVPGIGKKLAALIHTQRGDRHYTVLFSNTARAHELKKTHDWVVIYRDDGRGDRQSTVVTETHGPLSGCRVVRGRERLECLMR